jgi:hypothetical protein
MTIPIDLALYERQGRLVGLVEVKNKLGTTIEWARQTRRNLLAHRDLPEADYFLIVTPDRLYIWRRSASDPTAAEPDHVIDAREVFGRYFRDARLEPEAMSGFSFEMVVGSWLSDLARSDVELSRDLRDSGLAAAIREGHIEYEAAA